MDNATVQQEGSLTEQRTALRSRIRAWEQVAPIYMPGLLQYRADLAAHPSTTAVGGSSNSEDIELWLPSRVAPASRPIVCQADLATMEDQLRTAQCQDALNAVRHTLKVKTRMIAFKNRNVHGQREGTRSRAVIARVHEWARVAAEKYRAGRVAKMSLVGPGDWEKTLQVLVDGDIRGYQDANHLQIRRPRHGITEDDYVEPEPEATTAQGSEGPDTLLYAEAHTRHDGTGETRWVLSWIWCIDGAGMGEEGVDEVLRVEWAKSRARSHRATEEVRRLKEEMRRVLETLKWEEAEWKQQSNLRKDAKHDLAEGIRALSTTQASIKNSLRNHFQKLWKSPLEEVAETNAPVSVDANIDDANDEDEGGEDDEDEGEVDEERDGFGVPSSSTRVDDEDDDEDMLGR